MDDVFHTLEKQQNLVLDLVGGDLKIKIQRARKRVCQANKETPQNQKTTLAKLL